MSRRFLEGVKVTGKAIVITGTASRPALVGDRVYGLVIGSPLCFRFKEVHDFCSSHPLETVPRPTTLYHGPDAIRDLGMGRS